MKSRSVLMTLSALVFLLGSSDLLMGQSPDSSNAVQKRQGIGEPQKGNDHDNDGIPNGQDPDFEGFQKRSNSKGFIDENGDGLNDNAQDFDNDGIPNGQDPDYQPAGDGSGQQKGKTSRVKEMKKTKGDGDNTGPKGDGKRTGKKGGK